MKQVSKADFRAWLQEREAFYLRSAKTRADVRDTSGHSYYLGVAEGFAAVIHAFKSARLSAAPDDFEPVEAVEGQGALDFETPEKVVKLVPGRVGGGVQR